MSNALRACANSPSMSLAVVLSRGLAGLDAPLVTVEVHLAGGLPAFNLVGLARHRGPRVARPRARGAAERAVRVPGAQDHGEPRARRFAEGIRPLRSADRDRHPRRDEADSRRRARELRIRGRARVGRRAASDSRRAADGALRAPRRPRVRAACRERGGGGARARGRRLSGGLAPRGVRRTSRAASRFHRRSRRDRARRNAVAVSRSRRRARPGAGEARADDRRRGRAQPADDRTARHRQVDARAAPAGDSAAAHRRRSAGERVDRFARRALFAGDVGRASVPRAASHGERRRAGRRRQRSAAGRNLARASRRPLSRRVARMGSPRARSVARAARVGRHPHLARRAAEHVSRRVPVRLRDESVPVRLARPRERTLSLRARTRSRAIGPRCRARCSTGSTSASKCLRSPPKRSRSGRSLAKRRRASG